MIIVIIVIIITTIRRRRKEGGRDLICAEDSVKGEVNSLSWYLKCSMGKLLEGMRMAGTLETENEVKRKERKRKYIVNL